MAPHKLTSRIDKIVIPENGTAVRDNASECAGHNRLHRPCRGPRCETVARALRHWCKITRLRLSNVVLRDAGQNSDQNSCYECLIINMLRTNILICNWQTLGVKQHTWDHQSIMLMLGANKNRLINEVGTIEGPMLHCVLVLHDSWQITHRLLALFKCQAMPYSATHHCSLKGPRGKCT